MTFPRILFLGSSLAHKKTQTSDKMLISPSLWLLTSMCLGAWAISTPYLDTCLALVDTTAYSNSVPATCSHVPLNASVIGQVCLSTILVDSQTGRSNLAVTFTITHPEFRFEGAQLFVAPSAPLVSIEPSSFAHNHNLCSMHGMETSPCVASRVSYLIPLHEAVHSPTWCAEQDRWDLFVVAHADLVRRNPAAQNAFDGTLLAKAFAWGCDFPLFGDKAKKSTHVIQCTSAEDIDAQTRLPAWQPASLQMTHARSQEPLVDLCMEGPRSDDWGWAHPAVLVGTPVVYDLFVAGSKCTIDALRDPATVPVGTATILLTSPSGGGQPASGKIRIDLTSAAKEKYPQLTVDTVYLYLSCTPLVHINALAQSQVIISRQKSPTGLLEQDIFFSPQSLPSTGITIQTNKGVSASGCEAQESFTGVHVSFVLLQ